jgi:RimJ/RimL family protein N-acetyltransferase
MTTIYAVNRGMYSDHRVIALFTTPELAQDFMRTFPYEYNELQTFELDSDAPRLIQNGHSIWHVQMLRDGTTESVHVCDPEPYNFSSLGHCIWRRSKAPAYRGKGVPDSMQSTVLATSKKHAVKIANEHRIRMIESGEWTP